MEGPNFKSKNLKTVGFSLVSIAYNHKLTALLKELSSLEENLEGSTRFWMSAIALNSIWEVLVGLALQYNTYYTVSQNCLVGISIQHTCTLANTEHIYCIGQRIQNTF
jgi:hypothetical protein